MDYLRRVHVAAASKDAFSRRLQLVTGKGGVGKSTLVAALALEAARRGRRPLIVDPGDSQALRQIFDVEAIGGDPVAVATGVRAVRLAPQQALRAYLREYLPMRSWAEPVARLRPLQRFFHAAPGAVEVVMLYELQRLLEDAEADWDPILIDMDATGHALMFLQLPAVFEGLLSRGPLQRLLDRVTGFLTDADTTCMHLVALPRELVVQETLELHQALSRTRPVPWGCLFINGVSGAGLAPLVAARLRTLEDQAVRTSCHPLLEDLRLARLAIDEQARARAFCARLRELSMPTVALPHRRHAWQLSSLCELGHLAVAEAGA